MAETTYDPSTDWHADRTRPVVYCVQSWFHPTDGGPYLKWLEDKHMAEVLAEPGMLQARRVVLDQTDENGWWCCLLIYDLENRGALDAYLESPARDKFWSELEAFGNIHYSERFWGEVDFRIFK
ncbi:MAG: DUF4286 family protein [Rhodospirillales bacterium]